MRKCKPDIHIFDILQQLQEVQKKDYQNEIEDVKKQKEKLFFDSKILPFNYLLIFLKIKIKNKKKNTLVD